MRNQRHRALLGALVTAFLCGCAGEAGIHPAGGDQTVCEESFASGVHLLPFGPVAQEITAGGEVKVSVVVIRGADPNGSEGAPLPERAVSFRLLNPADGVELDVESKKTDADGLAHVILRAASSAVPQIYQVQAATVGTCAQAFSVDVRRPLRQLRAVTVTPFDTFTHVRVPLSVEATTNANARLAGEEIKFRVDLGGTSETLLSTASGAGGKGEITVRTDANGRATVMLVTGSTPNPQLNVVASLEGTADVVLQLRVAPGQSSSCKDDWDCPLGYLCEASLCQPPVTVPPTGCTVDADCPKPTICQPSTGHCLEPTGKPCDAIEGTGCEAEEICIGGHCAKVPQACSNNGDCPAAWRCNKGACEPQGTPPTGGCKVPKDCPANQTCINGDCVPKSSCNLPHAPDRLKGSWQVDSTLYLREALSGFAKTLLGAAGKLRDILEGKFGGGGGGGMSSILKTIMGSYVQRLVGQFIPPWGQQLVVALGNINDIIDDMRVLSRIQMTPLGNDGYQCSEEWDLVEFEYRGQKISTVPSAVPEIGQVAVRQYRATEVCGVVFFSKHRIQNTVGGLLKWAIHTALSLVTCPGSSTPCFNSLEGALAYALNCPMLAMQFDALAGSLLGGVPLGGILSQVCEVMKQGLIEDLNKSLNSLTSRYSVLELSGTANAGAQGTNEMKKGTWYGVLGRGLLKGNFHGDFRALRQ